MACQEAGVDELCDDKKPFSNDCNQQTVTEKTDSQPRVQFEKTIMHCEFTHDQSSKNRIRSDSSTQNPTTSDAEPSPQFPLNLVTSSSASSLSYNQTDLTKEESKKSNVPTTSLTTTVNFVNTKLHVREVEEASTERFNRPQERIHFFTPEVEEKYRKIVGEITHEAEITSSEASRNCSLNRKRKLPSEIFIEPPEVPNEIVDKIATSLGPIPAPGSNLFKGMSFILSCGSRDVVDPHQLEMIQSTADAENEEQWTRKPFVMARLIEQLKAGGGEVYDNFELVPPEKYKTTMLITNVPNLTSKSLLCLSVGIAPYNHQWIIRCCKEDKIVNPAEDQLPAGWSLIKQSYVEMFQRLSLKPFLSATLPVIVVIPMHPEKQQFVSLWGMICQNAGAVVLLVKYPSDNFIEGTVVLTHSLCPSWLIEKAQSWGIPLVSTRWAIQCLIEGQICSYDAHPSFDYNYVKNS